MSKVLVAYFSAEGNTAGVAKRLAEAVGADLFEIKPQEPYSKADINWKNPLSRCNREKMGKKDVPVAQKVDNFTEYSVVFLGFPIWYYGAPNIINTFVKGYDWTGKRIALFATSGGSDMGRTAEKLAPFLNGKGEIDTARLFAANAGEDELHDWAKKIIMPWTGAETEREKDGRPGFEAVLMDYSDRFNRMRNMKEEDFPEQNK